MPALVDEDYLYKFRVRMVIGRCEYHENYIAENEDAARIAAQKEFGDSPNFKILHVKNLGAQI